MKGAETCGRRNVADKLVGQDYLTNLWQSHGQGEMPKTGAPRACCSKLLYGPMPHARVVRIDTSAALAMPGVKAILTVDVCRPWSRASSRARSERGLTMEPLYHGEPILRWRRWTSSPRPKRSADSDQ